MTHSNCFFLVGGATPHSGPASSTLAVWTGQIIRTHSKKKKKVVNRTWTSHNSGLKQEWCGLGASAARIMRRLLAHGSGAAAICRTVGCLFRRCKTPPSISTRRAENRAGCPKVICQRQTRRLKRGGAQSLSQPPVQIFYRRRTEPEPPFEHRNKEFSRLWNVFLFFPPWKNSKHVQFVNLLFYLTEQTECFTKLWSSSLNASIWKTAQPQHLGRHTWSKKNKIILIT